MVRSCWGFPYRKRYYLTHPLKFVKHCFNNIGAAWRRSTKGWCYCDCWNMNDWMLTVLPEMLEHLRDNGCGINTIFYKDDLNDNEAAEKRRNDCFTEIIQHLYNATEDCEKAEQKNEYKEAYYKNIENGYRYSTHGPSTIMDKYHERESELDDYRQEELKKAFSMLAEIFPTLWD